MAGGRRIPITVEADTRGDFHEAADGLDKVARSGDDAEKSLGKVAKSGDDADGSLRKMSKGSQALDAEISKTARSVKALRDEFERTGDVGLLKDASKLDNARKGLERLKASFVDVGKAGTQAGVQAGEGFISNLTKDFTRFAINPSAVGSPLVAGIVLASPAIGAAVGAAVSLGLGAGVLAGGIYAAAQDSRVRDAWGSVIDSAGEKFKAESSVFAQPLVESASIVGAAFGRVIPKIGADFAELAPRITSISTGASGMLDNIFKGGNFDRVIGLSGKLMDKFALELPNIGMAVSDMLGSVADSGPGVQQFWSDFLTGTEKTIVGVGNVTEALSKTYDFLGGEKSIGKRINDMVNNDIIPSLDKGGHWLDDHIGKPINDFFGQNNRVDTKPVKQGFEDVGQGADDAARKIDKAAKALSGFISQSFGMQDSTLAMQKGLFDIAAAFDQNGASLDITTEKGLANREAMQRQIETIAQWRQQQLDAHTAPEAVNAAVDQQIQKMYEDARAHHANTAQLDTLIGSWRTMLQMPSNKSITTTYTTIQRFTTEQIAGYIDTGHRINGVLPRRWGGITEHAATGLLRDPAIYSAVSSGARYAFAEPATGGEAFVPKNGDPGRSMGILSQAASWYGADVVPRSSGYASPVVAGGGGAGGVTRIEVVLSAAPGDHQAELMLSQLRPVIRGSYGGNVQVALGGAS